MLHVVIIDDEPLVCCSIRDILMDVGHCVNIAADGYIGIELVKDTRPDLVIIDIIMPNRDGIDLIQDLRRSSKTLKIVAMSGGGRHGNIDHLEYSLVVGADVTLRKPFVATKLLEAVDTCCFK